MLPLSALGLTIYFRGNIKYLLRYQVSQRTHVFQ